MYKLIKISENLYNVIEILNNIRTIILFNVSYKHAVNFLILHAIVNHC